jgi:hypothetical protein
MKLVIITAIKEFEKDIKLLLKKAAVVTFSYRDVIGFRDATEEAIESNWFASEMNTTDSIMFYAFVPQKNVDSLFETIVQFNSKQATPSHIHIAIVPIEKSN